MIQTWNISHYSFIKEAPFTHWSVGPNVYYVVNWGFQICNIQFHLLLIYCDWTVYGRRRTFVFWWKLEEKETSFYWFVQWLLTAANWKVMMGGSMNFIINMCFISTHVACASDSILDWLSLSVCLPKVMVLSDLNFLYQ